MAAAAEPRVAGLQVRAVDVPLTRPIETAVGAVRSAPFVLIDLRTTEGITGSAYVFAYTTSVLGPLARLVANLEESMRREAVAPLELGWRLRQRFRLLGTPGLVGMALAGVDMAAWDVLARAAQLPLAELLGGRVRPIPAYASLRSTALTSLLAEVEEALELGFRHVKLKLGHGPLSQDLAAVDAVRRAVGDAVTILVDYNQALTVPEAVSRAAALDGRGVGWIEEPVPADDLAGAARVATAAAAPVQLGENWWGPGDVARALATGACDECMLDVMKIGGVSGWLQGAALAATAGMPLSSHTFPEFSAHLLAVSPTARFLEHLDKAAPILERPVTVEGGQVLPPPGPGAGLSWNEPAVRRYLVE
ncbi:MAG TPA: enolase C-terminal domain-like protein [Thermomicrobiaceae bacterium]|nr:enolase C-terminal domain-like protein [Thermomicrobiaceae bacterium]